MNKQAFFPDYSNSILNFSCSILKYFGVKPKHSTLSSADKILNKNFKHVVVILLDGFGVNIMEKHLAPSDFLRFCTEIYTHARVLAFSVLWRDNLLRSCVMISCDLARRF